MKLHKKNYTYKSEHLRLSDVSIETIKGINRVLTHNKPVFPLSRGNGRVIYAFKNRKWYERFKSLLSSNSNYNRDIWLQYGKEKEFQTGVSSNLGLDDSVVIVAEFWTEQKYELEQLRKLG